MRLQDLPFEYSDAYALLGFDEHRLEPCLDYAGFGWTRVASIELADRLGGVRRLDNALLVVAHTSDDAEPGPLVLEFWLRQAGEDVAVQVALEAFLEHHVAPRLGQESSVVLVICNPHREPVHRPSWLGSRAWVYGEGDVTAWLIGGDTYRLEAEAWIIQPAETAA